MLLGNYQVVDVLLLAGNVMPIALYFLALGLLNSYAKPYLTTGRRDFIVLTIVLVPVLFWPVPAFVQSGAWWAVIASGTLAAAAFAYLLPRRNAGFVIYNISEARCLRLLDDSLRACGRAGCRHGNTWIADDTRCEIHVRSFSLLRNVSLHVECADPQAADEFARSLDRELQRQLDAFSQLPSAMGAGLVLLGLTLMTLPMWMVSRHIDDLVDAMSHLFG